MVVELRDNLGRMYVKKGITEIRGLPEGGFSLVGPRGSKEYRFHEWRILSVRREGDPYWEMKENRDDFGRW